MKYWELNENRQMVALVDFWNVKAGDVGATIPDSCQLGSDEYRLWVDSSVKIGKDLKIGDRVTIGKDVIIGDYVKLGAGAIVQDRTTIGNGVIIGDAVKIGNDVKIGDDVKIGNYVDIGHDTSIGNHVGIGHYTSIGALVKVWYNTCISHNVSIGNCVNIGHNAKITDNAHLEQGNFIQFVGFGLKNRTIIICKVKDKNDPVISVGCKYQLSLIEFKERIENNEGTSIESTKIYKDCFPMFENSYNYVKNC